MRLCILFLSIYLMSSCCLIAHFPLYINRIHTIDTHVMFEGVIAYPVVDIVVMEGNNVIAAMTPDNQTFSLEFEIDPGFHEFIIFANLLNGRATKNQRIHIVC